jgi:lipoate-protein ligase A
VTDTPAPAPWRVEHVELSVAAAHDADLTGPGAGRLVRVHAITTPALVLGSGQRDDVVDRAAVARAGVDVVRRHSGGGAVLLAPGAVAWLDVVVPAGDPLWHDDVAVASHWLGSTWAVALRRAGAAAVAVHRGRLVRTPWSSLVCFAGLGPGEVTVGGRTVVGISQRRTRHGARFQVAVLAQWDVVGILALLALSDGDRAAAASALATVAAGAAAPVDVLVAHFLDAVG